MARQIERQKPHSIAYPNMEMLLGLAQKPGEISENEMIDFAILTLRAVGELNEKGGKEIIKAFLRTHCRYFNEQAPKEFEKYMTVQSSTNWGDEKSIETRYQALNTYSTFWSELIRSNKAAYSFPHLGRGYDLNQWLDPDYFLPKQSLEVAILGAVGAYAWKAVHPGRYHELPIKGWLQDFQPQLSRIINR